MSTNETRTIQLQILKIFLEFEKVCLEHNLRFYLTAGSLLGAIRHKGFIPWDDDMDVAMPRKDYEILIENASKWLPHPYELDCREKNNLYPYRFAKVHDVTTTFDENKSSSYVGGIFLDVFPFDGLPNGKIRQKLHLWIHRRMDRLLYFSIRDPFKRGKRFDSYLLLLFQKIVSPERVYKHLKAISTKYDFETSKYITDHDFKLEGIIEKKFLGDTPTKVVFEGHETFGINDWDSFLTAIYGDYMQVPAPEKRKKHFHKFMSLNLPFEKYKRKLSLQ